MDDLQRRTLRDILAAIYLNHDGQQPNIVACFAADGAVSPPAFVVVPRNEVTQQFLSAGLPMVDAVREAGAAGWLRESRRFASWDYDLKRPDRLAYVVYEAVLDEENRDRTPDNKTDNKKKSGRLVPEDGDVCRLANLINRRRKSDPKPLTKREYALEFTQNDPKKAKRLLRQLQPSRYGHLLTD